MVSANSALILVVVVLGFCLLFGPVKGSDETYELDENLRKILDQLYAKSTTIRKVNHKKTFEKLKEAEKLLPPKVFKTIEAEVRLQLKYIPAMIRIATLNQERCNKAELLGFYEFLLRRVDSKKWIEDRKGLGSVKRAKESSPSSPAYAYVKYYQRKQLELCQKGFHKSVANAVKGVGFWDHWGLIDLKLSVKRSFSKDSSKLEQVTRGCQKSLSRRWKKDWKNKKELQSDPTKYEKFFDRTILSKCLAANENLGPILENYQKEMKRFIKKDRLTEGWLAISEICGVIISNAESIRNECLRNELNDSKPE